MKIYLIPRSYLHCCTTTFKNTSEVLHVSYEEGNQSCDTLRRSVKTTLLHRAETLSVGPQWDSHPSPGSALRQLSVGTAAIIPTYDTTGAMIAELHTDLHLTERHIPAQLHVSDPHQNTNYTTHYTMQRNDIHWLRYTLIPLNSTVNYNPLHFI